MSLGAFDSKFHWWWEGAHFARLEHSNGAWLDIFFDPMGYDMQQRLVSIGVPEDEAKLAREVSFSSPSHDDITVNTGYGQAATVLNTVANIVRAYVRYREPPVVSFLADGVRAKVYTRLVRMLEIPLGYQAYRAGLPGGTYGADYHLVGPAVTSRVNLTQFGYERLR